MSDIIMPGSELVIPGEDDAPQVFQPGDVAKGGGLTVEERTQLEAALQHGWKLTPATMAYKITGGRWIPAMHLKYISKVVAMEIAKGNARIIVTMPARHGKSEFLSVHTPIWFLEHWPQKYVMNISYGLDLATDFSLRVRTTFLDEDLHHLLSTRLRRDKLKIDRFLTTEGGGVTAAGIGGVITGRGADLLLIDDYIKNAEEALSEAQNKSTWQWFLSTAYTRLEPGASVVILATRWGQEDLIGRCLTELAHENWTVINLPALAEEGDLLGRKVGEALWPARYPEKRLQIIKKTLGPYWWSAMFQQNPKASMSGADLGEKLRVIDFADVPHETHLRALRAWDLASTENAGDYTSGPKIAYHADTGIYIILDMQRFQKTPFGMESMLNTVACADGHGIQIWIEQEPGSAGNIAIDHIRREVLPGFAVSAEKPSGRIEVRASPFLAAVEAGLVYMVKAPWNAALRKELNAFPEGEHDDQISALALGYNKISAGKYGRVVWGREPKKQRLLRTHAPHVTDETKSTRGVIWGRNVH